MRRFLLLPIVAAAFAVPAAPANAYLVNGCAAGDYRVVDLTVAGREIAEVCTTESPVTTVGRYVCLPCIVK